MAEPGDGEAGAPVPSAEEMEAAGLYDPEAPDAADRLGLLRFVLARGATYEEIREADEAGGLGTVAADLALRLPGERVPFDEACRRAGVPEERAVLLWRALGFPDPADAHVLLASEEVDMLRELAGTGYDLLGEYGVRQVARATGMALARLAEAEVAAFRVHFEAPRRSGGVDSARMAHEYEAVIRELLPRFVSAIDVVHRRYLTHATRTLWSTDDEMTTAASPLAVGFADVVGSTSRLAAQSPAELARAIDEFEDRLAQVVRGAGGRLVKLIGDEGMFVAGDAATACEVARSLVAAFDADPNLPALRVGVDAGLVLTIQGDYYGEVVNRAARLTDAAGESEILVTAAVRDEVGGDGEDGATGEGYVLEDAGVRPLRGFDHPVAVYRLVPR